MADMASELPSMMTTAQDSALEITHETTGSSVTPSSSRGAAFYFRCAVLTIGVVGTAANGMVVYALVASKQHKKHVLIFNQNAQDFVNCFFMVVQGSLELGDIRLTGTGGYWLCLTILSQPNACSSAAYFGSLVSLAAVSVERYLKVVHHVWAKNKLRDWMIYSAISFSWISGVVIAAASTAPTTSVVNGVCYSGMFFLSETARKAYAIWDFLSFYVVILAIFIFCYGRILVFIRRQAHVMAAHSGQGSNIAQDLQSNRIQTSVIRTTILVSGSFAVTWAPLQINNLLIHFLELSIDENVLYTVLFIAYIYICINPFIYATKFDPVKRVLLAMIPCKKNAMQAPESGHNN